jgi:predicted ATPase
VLADEGLLEQRRRRLAKRYILGGRNGAGKTNIGI